MKVVGAPWHCPGCSADRHVPADGRRHELLGARLVHLGEVLLAPGATELYPSVADGPVVRDHDGLVAWWDAVTRNRTNLMTVHLTSSVRMGEDRSRTGADSFGRGGVRKPARQRCIARARRAGREPTGTIMAIAARNSDQFLSET